VYGLGRESPKNDVREINLAGLESVSLSETGGGWLFPLGSQ
jgi:hypothetical protein